MTSSDQAHNSNELQQLVQELSQYTTTTKIQALQRSIHFKAQAPRRQLLHALTDRDIDVRAAAAQAIEELKPWIIDEQWLESLQESIWPVHDAAMDVLASLGKHAPFKPLLRAALSQRIYSRRAAQAALKVVLTRISAELRDKLILQAEEYLQDTAATASVQIISLELLGSMDDNHVSLETILPFLSNDNTDVRLAALDQLRKRGEQHAILPIEPIAELLSDPNERIRYRTVLTLDTQGEAFQVDLLLTAMHDSDEAIVYAATDILGRRRVIQAIPALLQQLLTDPNDDWMEYTDSVFETLHACTEHVPLDLLLSALDNQSDRVRHRAIWLLSRLEARTPVEILINLLEHKNPATRQQAVVAMGNLLTRVPLETIVNKLQDHHRAVRKTASNILRRNTIEIPEELLMPYLDAPEHLLRITAIELLGDRLPLARLLAATRDPKWTVRAAALGVLSTMGPQVPLDLFLEALCDRNLSIRRAALLALGKQEERTPVRIIVAALHDRRRVSRTAMEVLSQLGRRVVPRELLLPLLDDPMAHVRVFGIELLTTIAYDEPFPTERFKEMLQDHDVSVRKAALQALAQLQALEPATLLLLILHDDDRDVRRDALDALTQADNYSPQDLAHIKALLGERRTYRCAIQCLQKNHQEILSEVTKEASDILMFKGAGSLLGSIQQEYIIEAIENMHAPGPLLINKLVQLQGWPYEDVQIKASQALRKLAASKKNT